MPTCRLAVGIRHGPIPLPAHGKRWSVVTACRFGGGDRSRTIRRRASFETLHDGADLSRRSGSDVVEGSELRNRNPAQVSQAVVTRADQGFQQQLVDIAGNARNGDAGADPAGDKALLVAFFCV